MSEHFAENNEPKADGPSDEEVSEVVEELMRSVEEDSAATAAESAEAEEGKVKTKPKAPAKKATPRRRKEDANPLFESVEALSATARSLSQSIEMLTAEKTQLSAEKAELAAELKNEEVAAKAEQVALTRGALATVALEHGRVLATFGGFGLVAAAFMAADAATGVLLGALGAVLFLTVPVLENRSEGMTAMASKAGASALLLVGLAAVVGGVQFFGQEAARAAVLIPVGIAALSAGIVLRSPVKPAFDQMMWIASVVVWLCLMAAVGLHLAAAEPEKPALPGEPVAASHDTPAGDHGAAPAGDHGAAPAGDHAAAPAAGEHGEAADHAAAVPAASTEDHAAEGDHAKEEAATDEDHGDSAEAETAAADATAAKLESLGVKTTSGSDAGHAYGSSDH